jgi:2-iminobutanoate/2-iminopropanoate deaminase
VRHIARTRLIPAKGYFHSNVKSTPGLKVGNMVFVAGQVARDAAGRTVGVGDVVAQFHQAMRNLKAVMAEAGADLGDIVKITQWLTDMSRIHEVLDARREYFEAVPPSSSLGVTRLANPEHLIEIEAIAVLDQ